jgi:hypothetical protein
MSQEQGNTYKPSTSGPKIPVETPLQKNQKDFEERHPVFSFGCYFF